ncbi:signal transduction histidine kinase/CheY-like chemotaxis protein [Filimonas zeae]|nr:ATP-binding protein [Filimonas zeae]MDR6339755.1 signal transduction histidine kinase/CheY-like chemotaxis protein [Filimonas zeae]
MKILTGKPFLASIMVTFLTGLLLLLSIQWNSDRNIDALITGNERLMRELRITNYLRELERDIIWVESRIRGAIATDDTSHIEGVAHKINEIENYLDTLDDTNTDPKSLVYINRLNYLARQKLRARDMLMEEYVRSGRMDDTSFIANPMARETSNEISSLVRKIYENRQDAIVKLTSDIENSGRKAKNWGTLLVIVILISGVGWLWFIIKRIQYQNTLILQLNESENRAREAARIKENFMANMSHEIRTPLNAILGFSNFLEREQLDHKQKDFAVSIRKASENLLDIVNDILDVSRIEAGMVRIEAYPFSVRGLLQSVETLFCRKATEKGIHLLTQVADSVPDTLIGDATRLTQILVNLIGNALKFTEKGQVRILVTVLSRENNEVNLNCKIIDNGPGIEQDKLKVIFERFNQGENSITRRFGGTGLGLSIVKDLIELQNGSIEVTSVVGEGSTFRFNIPYQVSETQLEAPAHWDGGKFEQDPQNGIRILIAEDNATNRSLMTYMLQQWGLEFDMVDNGKMVIEALGKRAYSLVLMDMQMPVMDGYTATRSIREDLQLQIPIIAMTAHAMAGEREKCLSMGMNEYISKPIRERQLFDMIARFCNITEKTAEPEIVPEPAPTAALPEQSWHYIQLDYLLDIAKGDTEFMKVSAQQFIDFVPGEVEDLMQACKLEAIPAMNKIAHHLKTTISIMGLTDKLHDALSVLEDPSIAKQDAIININFVKACCDAALDETRRFHQSL